LHGFHNTSDVVDVRERAMSAGSGAPHATAF
jgi:hypothetical protein